MYININIYIPHRGYVAFAIRERETCHIVRERVLRSGCAAGLQSAGRNGAAMERSGTRERELRERKERRNGNAAGNTGTGTGSGRGLDGTRTGERRREGE